MLRHKLLLLMLAQAFQCHDVLLLTGFLVDHVLQLLKLLPGQAFQGHDGLLLSAVSVQHVL